MVKMRASEYIDGDTVKRKGYKVFELIDEGKNVAAKDTPFGRATSEIGIKTEDGEQWKYTLNQTTKKKMINAWGEESKNWVGKKLSIRIAEQQVRGELKNVIYGEPAK